MQTNKIFPEVYNQLSVNKDGSLTMIIQTWLRIERSNVVYLLFVEDIKNISSNDVTALINLKDTFVYNCFISLYLWEVPSNDELDRLIANNFIKISKNNLTMKENLLLNLNLQ